MFRPAFAALACAAVLGGCDKAPAPPSNVPASVSQAPAAPASQAGLLVVGDANGQALYTLTLDGSHAEVSVGPQRYAGEQKGDKRRWRTADGSAFAEVKAKGDDFKLRTPDGALLWKVKLDDDKIKISDNEENRNPWVLKTRYEDKAKVLSPDEREIGTVRFQGERTKVKDASDAERYIIATQRRSAAWGVLLMDGIPEAQRAIIAAELIARQR
jgi:hypothetical protein